MENITVSDSVDQDQTARSVHPDLDLHCQQRQTGSCLLYYSLRVKQYSQIEMRNDSKPLVTPMTIYSYYYYKTVICQFSIPACTKSSQI